MLAFVLVLFPSTVVQSMDVSGLSVSTGPMAFSYILVYLDGIVIVTSVGYQADV
jgi:hypothetical protein